jgi:hypothetical protein
VLSRRSWLKRFGAIVATVALAPEIAFRAKLEVTPVTFIPPPAYVTNLHDYLDKFYQLARARGQYPEIDIWTDRATAEKIHNAVNRGTR